MQQRLAPRGKKQPVSLKRNVMGSALTWSHTPLMLLILVGVRYTMLGQPALLTEGHLIHGQQRVLKICLLSLHFVKLAK